MSEPDNSDLLTSDQFEALARIRVSCDKCIDVIEKINERAFNLGLPLRNIPNFPFFLVKNDISRLMYAHHIAEEKNRDAAMEKVGA
jgi:hypothetical protein